MTKQPLVFLLYNFRYFVIHSFSTYG
ncbi:hypothetical protein MED222_06000 [Vibrio sp. MED222]|nr:hypothetical protein MED222_06000 [Vibrio sp. MED222]